MVRIAQILLRRGRFVARDDEPRSRAHTKFGPLKWRDYRSPLVDPPYWYKWSLQSPYSPAEQSRIRGREDVGWYTHNYDKIKLTPPEKWLIHVGDKVQILKGKDKGKTGTITRIIPERNWVVVGGRNLKYRHERGEVVPEEQPLEHDEVSLLDPVHNEPTDVSLRADEDGSLVRVSDKSGHIIKQPPKMLHDWTPINEYMEESKDTMPQAALERTYVPSVNSMEDELKNIHKIEDDDKKRTFFWY